MTEINEEFPQMILPLMVACFLLFASLLVYGMAMHLVVCIVVRLIRSGSSVVGFWKSVAFMAMVTGVMATAHLIEIALWAAPFLVCGQVSNLETAYYLSAQCYTSLGFGDVPLSRCWRLLGPLEAINGLLFFGLSTAVLFAIMSQLIADRLRTETGHQVEATGKWTPEPVAGDAWSS